MKEIFYVLNKNKAPCRSNGEIKKFTSKEEAAEWAQKQKDFIGVGRYKIEGAEGIKFYVADWLEKVLFEV